MIELLGLAHPGRWRGFDSFTATTVRRPELDEAKMSLIRANPKYPREGVYPRDDEGDGSGVRWRNLAD
jgi:hypothetical protein